MDRRINRDEYLKRHRETQRAYIKRKMEDPEFREAQRKYHREYQARMRRGEKIQPRLPKIKITVDEFRLWCKYRKIYGDPVKYDWKSNL